MFALHKIVDDKLYAIALGEGKDVFHECFERWQDPVYVYSYFEGKEEALQFYNVTKKRAAQLILQESKQFFSDILEYATGQRDVTTLDETIFIPLHHNDDFNIPLLETKAYGNETGTSFTRMYAIRLQDGCYIVVGGLIKTTKALQECDEGQEIIDRIKQLAAYLRKNNFNDAFDIAVIVL